MNSELILTFNAPWYIDLVLAIACVAAMLLQAWLITVQRRNVGRWLLMVGWAGLSVRMFWALIAFGDVNIPAGSMPFVLCLAIGSIIVSLDTHYRSSQGCVKSGVRSHEADV
jgi:lipopolysaccharide export LptBFGC system permease protein LptF